MFIKRLEIFGFKSFKSKTVFEFENNKVTGIVGPNGCGKSNLVDALLWVMGESAPKHLRGGTLSDIIFGGTAKEPPGNIAEVILTLSQGSAPFPEDYKDFSEVMISRRASRDGKNEYFINQQTCLLKDIREFFMNTGAGCRGFSVIEQAAIERLVTAKPIQRRFIIEEVAGITKFKSRKEESVRKLELVNQNLQRLDDILKIQESHLSQLTSQAKKAEKYKKLKAEIESRQKQISSKEQEELFRSYQNLKESQQEEQAKRQTKRKESQSLEAQREKETLNIQKIEKRIKESQAGKERLKQEITNKHIELASWRDKSETFKMIENIKKKKQSLEEKEKSVQRNLKGIQNFFKSQGDIKGFEKESEEIKTHLEEAGQNRKGFEINIKSLQKQIDFIDREIGALAEDKQAIQSQIQKSLNDKNKIRASLKKNKQNSSALSRNIADLCAKEKILESKKKNLEEELKDIQQKVLALQHKVEEIKKLTSRSSAFNEGAKALMLWRPDDFQPLWESLKAESEYAVALGAVLGYQAQALIPNSEGVGMDQAIQRLKDHKKGKTGFLSTLPGLSVSTALRQEMRGSPALICFLDEKIKWTVSTSPLKAYLEQTAVVSDLNSAFELKKRFPAFQFVTLEGDLVTRDSFVYAGSSGKESSLFQLRAKVDEYSRELSQGEMELKVKKMDLESCAQKLEPLYEEKHQLQVSASQTLENLISLKKDIEHKERDILRLSESRAKKDQKDRDFQKEKQNLLDHGDAYKKEIQGLNELISFKESRLQALQKTINEHKTHHLKKEEWERALWDCEKGRQNLDQEISLLLNLIEPSKGSEKSDISDDYFEKKILLLQGQEQKLKDKEQSLQKEIEQEIQLKGERESAIKNIESQIFQIKLDINHLKAEEEKKELEQTYLKNKFLESYHLPLEEFVSSGESIPLENLKEEVEHYEKQLDRIKEVNFLALQEYEKLSKENFFLNEQKEDLVSSRKEIMKVISHIDKLCSVRFNDMLEEINKRFSRVFPIVFQGDGAKAELILHEEEEGQDPGVDILIHPPGKRPQSVSLLSRGEKALTSICLIYSLFLVKPSPFCVIDEADAPLDDANIFRFLSILKEMSRKSQIITITHNKHTMQVCDKLYGVTMKSPGLSQVVSVDMKEIPSSADLAP